MLPFVTALAWARFQPVLAAMLADEWLRMIALGRAPRPRPAPRPLPRFRSAG